MTPREALQAADQSMKIIKELEQRGPEYVKAWDDFAEKFELPRELPRQGCGVFRPKGV